MSKKMFRINNEYFRYCGVCDCMTDWYPCCGLETCKLCYECHGCGNVIVVGQNLLMVSEKKEDYYYYH